MPNFNADQLRDIATRILTGAKVPADRAAMVAAELAAANLAGHDSHGIIRLRQYVDSIHSGVIVPEGKISVVRELPGTTVLDGGACFGQVVAIEALTLAKAKARELGTYTVFAGNTNHVGRLGSYTQNAAVEGFAALMAVNSPAKIGGVAPWGAIERRLGTNPISLAAPCGDDALVLDMTTSATAEGKVRVALQKGEAIPEGWVIDGYGQPTTNPADLYGKPHVDKPPGAIVPLGGAMGFKGFGLSVMLDVFCGILSGAGVVREDLQPGANGVWLYVVDVAQLLPLEEYRAWIEKYVAWIKSAKKAPGVEEILLPGEIETGRQRERSEQGVAIADGTWQQTLDLAAELNVSLAGLA